MIAAPHGVAYLSYNALPGGYLRQMVREILQYHTASLADGQRTIAEAQHLARVLADAMAGRAAAVDTEGLGLDRLR